MQNDLLEVAEARATAQDGKPKTSFSGGVRAIEGSTVEDGDRIMIAKDYKVWPLKIGDRTVEYTVAVGVDLQGNPVTRRIFPSLYQARIYEFVEKENKLVPTGTIEHNDGDAVNAYQRCREVDEGFKQLAGRVQVISLKREFTTRTFDRTELRTTKVFHINFGTEADLEPKAEAKPEAKPEAEPKAGKKNA